jgi:hypothetical protein
MMIAKGRHKSRWPGKATQHISNVATGNLPSSNHKLDRQRNVAEPCGHRVFSVFARMWGHPSPTCYLALRRTAKAKRPTGVTGAIKQPIQKKPRLSPIGGAAKYMARSRIEAAWAKISLQAAALAAGPEN